MRNKRILFGLLALAFLVGATTAEAGVFNDLSRYLGWGWSDGYHARPVGVPHGVGGYPRATYELPANSSGHFAPSMEYLPPPTEPTPKAAPKPAPPPTSSRRTPTLPSRHTVPKLVPLSP